MGSVQQKLGNQSVTKSFFQYLLPTFFGMMLMSVNIVVDGIFVGNGIGDVALASVNIAVPVFSVIISLALLIGVGGATLYSMAMGEGNVQQAQRYFTISAVFITMITIIVSIFSYIFIEPLALLFGANEETLPYALDYMKILILFSLVIAMEVMLSIFVRNDGNPTLAMMGMIVSAVFNIILNYVMIFVLGWEVLGAAIATVTATGLGLLVLATHFFKKGAQLRFVRFKVRLKEIKNISFLGFPSFLSEAGMGVFVIGYNVAMAYYLGTNGVAAFSVINYLHAFMFLGFLSIGSSIQPMISFYYGSRKLEKIRETVKIAERTAIGLGILFILIGYFGSDFLVSIFGVDSIEIYDLATNGITLFFLGYLFMGINAVYMTYYQSIGRVKPAVGITFYRGFIILAITLLALPPLFGAAGIWLALPIAEAIVAIFLIVFARKGISQEIRESAL